MSSVTLWKSKVYEKLDKIAAGICWSAFTEILANGLTALGALTSSLLSWGASLWDVWCAEYKQIGQRLQRQNVKAYISLQNMSTCLLCIHTTQWCLSVCGLCNPWGQVFNQTNSLNMFLQPSFAQRIFRSGVDGDFGEPRHSRSWGQNLRPRHIDKGDWPDIPQLKVGGNYPLSAAKAWSFQNFHQQPTVDPLMDPLAGCRIWQRHPGTQFAQGTSWKLSCSSQLVPQGWCSAGGKSSGPSFFFGALQSLNMLSATLTFAPDSWFWHNRTICWLGK